MGASMLTTAGEVIGERPVNVETSNGVGTALGHHEIRGVTCLARLAKSEIAEALTTHESCVELKVSAIMVAPRQWS